MRAGDGHYHQWDPGGSLAWCSTRVPLPGTRFGICPHLAGNPGPSVVNLDPVVKRGSS